tara:strand:+ start:5191 stop:5364 length:174 start_codon:yes stop_codon:yes gene_type:complete
MIDNLKWLIDKFFIEYPWYKSYDDLAEQCEYDYDSSSDYETESDVDSEDYDSVDSDE